LVNLFFDTGRRT